MSLPDYVIDHNGSLTMIRLRAICLDHDGRIVEIMEWDMDNQSAWTRRKVKKWMLRNARNATLPRVRDVAVYTVEFQTIKSDA